ncbi:MAG: type I restriction enzyme subunit R domain-containing protein, partial [Moorellaceae bacterium]
TPIDRTAHGKGTFKVFGQDDSPHGYLDKYSIAESIADGTTVSLYYSLAPNELRVERETLEKEFWSLVEAEGVSEVEELNRVLEKAVTLKNMLKNPDRIRRVAAYVAHHFTTTVEPMGFKAFLVAVDREACAFYKEALDTYLDPTYTRVVISPGPNDKELLKKHYLSEDEENEVRRSFRNPQALPKILIVTEKLLTGFDAPVLYCMYLDKPMRDHVLLQAIARVNRPYEDEEGRKKPGGFVLDFVGIFENLEKALAFDSQDVERVIEHLDVVKARFAELMARAREVYLPVCAAGEADKAAEAALEYFREENRRQEFYSFFRELEGAYEIISPDPWLRSYMDDYHRLADLYSLLRAAYESKDPLRRELARKTAELVREHTRQGLIEQVVDVFEVTPETLARIAEANQPDAVKVVNLLRVIGQLVESEGRTVPYLISIGERAELIAEAFRNGQQSAKATLERIRQLIEEINEAEKERAARNISPAAFTVLYLLKKSGLASAQAEEATQQVEEVFNAYPAWTTSEAQGRFVRREMYRILGKFLADKVADVVKDIMRILRRNGNGS